MRPTFLCVAFLITLNESVAAPKMPDREWSDRGSCNHR